MGVLGAAIAIECLFRMKSHGSRDSRCDAVVGPPTGTELKSVKFREGGVCRSLIGNCSSGWRRSCLFTTKRYDALVIFLHRKIGDH